MYTRALDEIRRIPGVTAAGAINMIPLANFGMNGGFTIVGRPPVDPDGAVYASNDLGPGVDRVLDGAVTLTWASVPSSNGLVVDTSGEWLYVAQTFVPAAISRVEIADPSHVETWYSAPEADSSVALDGLTRDAHDRLYAAANLGGQVWRVQEGGPGCVLTHLPPLGPSAVAFGSAEGKRPSRFGRRNLYVVTFQGDLIQLKNVRGQQPVAQTTPSRHTET